MYTHREEEVVEAMTQPLAGMSLVQELPLSLVERVNAALDREYHATPEHLKPYIAYTRQVRFWCDALEQYGHKNRSDALYKAMRLEFERELEKLWK